MMNNRCRLEKPWTHRVKMGRHAAVCSALRDAAARAPVARARPFVAEQRAMGDVHDERLLGGIVRQRYDAAAILQKSKDLPIPVEMHIKDASEAVAGG